MGSWLLPRPQRRHVYVLYSYCRWVDDLGDVDSNQVPQICKKVSAGVADFPSFEIRALGAGAFPRTERPRTLWLGVGQGEQMFVDVHDAVERSLEKLEVSGPFI